MAGSFYANQNLFLLRKAKAIILLKRLKVEKYILTELTFLENQYLIYRRQSSSPMVSRPIYP
jgi:hypothetical protein